MAKRDAPVPVGPADSPAGVNGAVTANGIRARSRPQRRKRHASSVPGRPCAGPRSDAAVEGTETKARWHACAAARATTAHGWREALG